MTKNVGIGSHLDVVFTSAPRGSRVTQSINGRPAYATESGPSPISGDVWRVMIVAMNPQRTVYFVEPLDLLHAADGLTDVLRPYSPFYHEYIREAEAEIADILASGPSLNAFLPDHAACDQVRDYLEEAILLPADYREQKLAGLLPPLSSIQHGDIYGHHETQHGGL